MFSASPRRAAFSSSLLSSSSASSLKKRVEETPKGSIRDDSCREREDKMEGSKMGSDSGHLKKKSRKTRRTMTVPVPARHLATDDDLFFRRPAEEAAAAVVLNDFGSRVLAADAATESIMVCGRPQ